MSINVIQAGGAATRLDGIAPYGCKALTPVGGRRIIEWQLDVLGSATIICRSIHAPLLRKYGPVIIDNSRGGPVAGLTYVPVSEGSITVVYADSFFTDLPEGDGWVGVRDVEGGRSWDLVYEDGHCEYAPLPSGMTGRACVGIYRFPDRSLFHLKVGSVFNYPHSGPVGMAPIVNQWPGLPRVEIPSWSDIGDPAALRGTERMFDLDFVSSVPSEAS